MAVPLPSRPEEEVYYFPKSEGEMFMDSLKHHRAQPDHLQDRDLRMNLKAVAKLGQTSSWDSPDLKLGVEALWVVEAGLHVFITSMLLARQSGHGEELQLEYVLGALASHPIIMAGYTALTTPESPVAAPMLPTVALAAVKTRVGPDMVATVGAWTDKAVVTTKGELKFVATTRGVLRVVVTVRGVLKFVSTTRGILKFVVTVRGVLKSGSDSQDSAWQCPEPAGDF